MKIKLMVTREVYHHLVEALHRYDCFDATCVNDIVSSTRRDPSRTVHVKETRRSLCKAALIAGGGAVGVRVVDADHFDEPVVARLTGVGDETLGGIAFRAELRRCS